MSSAVSLRAFRRKMVLYNFEDFCALVPDGQKADLIDGVIYMASPDNTEAAGLQGWLFSLLFLFIDEMDLSGYLYSSRVAFRINATNGPEPDIGYLRKRRMHLKRRGFIAGPPDLAVEIVSPDSIDRDYDLKFHMYETAGVPEYWIIDEIQKKVFVYQLGKDGRYHAARLRNGRYYSRVITNFWFVPDWFWQEPKPKVAKTLRKILAE